MERLIKVDRNGSKHFEDDVCEKCSGKGYIPAYAYVDGGICFLCGGTGTHHHTWVEHTPEYEEKLAARRAAKLAARADIENAKFLAKYGCSESGIIYIVLGNTYSIKNDLKAKGARYNSSFGGWYFAKPVDGYDLVEFDIKPFLISDQNGWFVNFDCNISDAVSKAKVANAGEDAPQWVAEVGDKLELILTLNRIGGYDTQYGWTSVYNFSDTDGNLFVWKTSAYLDDVKEGDMIAIKGTVKEHGEYRGVRQNVLTRCKVM